MRAIIFTGGIYHDFEKMSAATADILASAGMSVEIVSQPTEVVAALKQPADLLVIQGLRWRMLGNDKYEPFRAEWAYETGDDLKAALTTHVAGGGGIVSLHTGCICFDDWSGWQDILGGGWVWGDSFHAPGLESVRVTPVADHPVTRGVAPFTVSDEHYRNLSLHPGSIILAEGIAAAGVTHPVAWARAGGEFAGRAVTLTTGHDLASLTEPGQARLIQQAALWAARHNGERLS
jgi:type 1 glutamine amidotransferase